jgi:hypothetical protein
MKMIMAAASGAALLLAVPAQAGFQDAPQAPQEAPATPEAAAPAPDASIAPACKPKKKKKGPGLGGLLRAASSTGLVGSIANRTGSSDTYVAANVATTAAEAAESSASGQGESGC